MASVKIGFIEKKINSTKNTFTGTSLSCKLKEPCSMQSPVFIVQGLTKEQLYNFAEWESRYYWVDDVVYTSRDIQEVHCHLDPLATYKDDIKATTGFINFGPKDLWDKRLIDSRLNADRVFMSDAPIYIDNSTSLFSSLSGSGCVVMRIMNYDTASSTTGVATVVGSLNTYLTLLRIYVNDLDTDCGTLQTNFEKLVGKWAGLGNALDSILSAYWLPISMSTISTGTAYDGDIGGYNINSGWERAKNWVGQPFIGGPYQQDISISTLWQTYPWLLTPKYTKVTVTTPGGQVDISDVIFNFYNTTRISLTFTFFYNIDGDAMLVCRDTDSDKTFFVHSWNMAVNLKSFAKTVMSGTLVGIQKGIELGTTIVGAIASGGASLAITGNSIAEGSMNTMSEKQLNAGLAMQKGGLRTAQTASEFNAMNSGISGAVASMDVAQGSREFGGVNNILALFINGQSDAWKKPVKINVIRYIPEIMGDLGHYTSFCDKYGWPVLNYGDLSLDGPYQMAGATCSADAPPSALSTINSTINSLIIIE